MSSYIRAEKGRVPKPAPKNIVKLAPKPEPAPPPKPKPEPAPVPVPAPTKPPSTRIILPSYVRPAQTDLAVIVPFFNPTRSVRIAQNALLTTSLMRAAGIPVFVAELATGDDAWIFPETSNNYRYRSSSYMFYKENLFACVEKHVPPDFTKLALVDSDILFEMKDWYDQLGAALDSKQVIHPFETAHWLSINFRPLAQKKSVLVGDPISSHTGFVWAFQREWYRTAGLCEHALIGGGDSLFYARISGGRAQPLYSHEFNALPHIAKPSTGYLDQNVYHLFHGPIGKRQYDTRYETLRKYLEGKRLTRISDLVERRSDGILEWLPAHKDELNRLLLAYFNARNDDDI